MNPIESGHKGGISTRDNHSFVCPIMHKACVIMIHAYFGKTGGDTTLERHGREFYVENGKYSGRGITKEKRIAKFGYDPLAKRILAAESSGNQIQEGLESLPAPGSSN